MKLPNFRDADPYDPKHGGYSATNEHPDKIHQLLGDERVPHVAGILGGGDIALTVIASRGIEQFSFVDHSYQSMAAAMLKLMLVQVCGGARGTKQLLELGFSAVDAVVQRLRTEMPEVLRPHYRETDLWHRMNWITIMMEEWLRLPDDTIEQLAERADKMTFIHGDLQDLPQSLDLLYLSNALGHQGRNYKRPKIDDFTSHVRPHGRVLVATHSITPKFTPPGWLQDTILHAEARGRMMAWSYWSLRRAH